MNNRKTPLAASLLLTAFASTGTSVVWNGLPFIAKQYYDFNEVQNFSLFLVIAVVYVFSAYFSGKTTAIVNKVMSSRSIIAWLLLVQGTVCGLPLLFESAWVVWVAGCVAGFCSAWLWPLTESYLVVGRHGKEMRRVIGWWNVVWMVSVAAAMIAIAPLMESHASMAIVGLGVANFIAMVALPWFNSNPGKHDEADAIEHVPEGYKPLLRGARILLPLSYIFNGVLAPLLPFVLSRLDIDIVMQTPLAAVWMFSRVFFVFGMSRIQVWHGRWSVLWFCVIAMSIGLIGILIAGSIPLLVLALVIFGAGMGVTYYVAIYYAMSVGRAKVDAGGTHEALIGGGYMVGPMIGLGTMQIAHSDPSGTFYPLVTCVLLLMGLGIGSFWLIWKKDR